MSLSQPNFLTLSRELRDMIYDLVLTSHKPIVVWSGILKLTYAEEGTDSHDYEGPLTPIHTLIVDDQATTLSLGNITLGLLRTNKLVSEEAAMAFYSGNIFSFEGDHNWHPIPPWLDMIGKQNRGYLSRMNISILPIPRATQLADGTRVPKAHYPEILYQRSPYLHLSIPAQSGSVENINHPDISAIFLALADYTGSLRKTEIYLQLRIGIFPLYLFDTARLHPYNDRFTMDLPNLIEIFRSQCNKSCPNRVVDVIWKGTTLERDFVRLKEASIRSGWNILDSVPRIWVREIMGPLSLIDFTARLTPHTESALITAGECNPHT